MRRDVGAELRRYWPDDRGVIGLIPAIIALLTGAAIAAVTLVAVTASKSTTKDPDVYIAVSDANPTRDAKGRPHASGYSLGRRPRSWLRGPVATRR